MHGTKLPMSRRLNHKGSMPGNLQLLKVSSNFAVKSGKTAFPAELPPLRMPHNSSRSPPQTIPDSGENSDSHASPIKRKMSRSRSIIGGDAVAKSADQSSDSLKALSPINGSFKHAPEESKTRTDVVHHISKEMENTIKTDKSIVARESGIAHDMFCHRVSMNTNTFLGEGCASFLSQQSLLSKMTQNPKAVQPKINEQLNVFSLEALSSPELLGDQLALLVSTPSIDAIQLPPCRIAIADLTIQRNIVFIGTPGVQVVIQNKPLTIRAESTLPTTVKFLECAFTLVAATISTRDPQTLFEVHEGATLDLQDCQLKTEANISQDSRTEEAELCTISGSEQQSLCIHMLGYEGDDKQTIKAMNTVPPATVAMHSCSFMCFMQNIVADSNNCLLMDKCVFYKSQRSAITISNPFKLYVEATNIEDCGESGIEIKWTKPGTQEELTADRELKIVNNYIAEVKEHAISIVGTNSPIETYKAAVTILSNRVQDCAKDGINMKDAYFSELTIASNSLHTITGNGLGIYRSKIPKFAIKTNIIKHNQGTGIYLVSSSCTISSCECCENMLSGIVINGCSITEKKEIADTDVNIVECILKDNMQNGLTVLDLHSGVVLVERCMISANREYGLYLSNNEYLTARTLSLTRTSATNTTVSERKHRSKVAVDKGEISCNKYGLYLQQQFTYIDCTMVKGNAEYAICMPNKASGQYLELSAATHAKKCIQGLVGGSWGSAMANSRGDRCGCTVCAIV